MPSITKTLFLALSATLLHNPVFATNAAAVELNLKQAVALGELIPDQCELTWNRTASKGEKLSINRVVTCAHATSREVRRFVQVQYEGKVLFTTLQELLSEPLDRSAIPEVELSNISTELAAVLAETKRKQEQEEAQAAKERALAQSRRVAELRKSVVPGGVGIVEFRPYDVSEHTDGTGVRVSIANLSNKTIRYITFSYIGLNAVDDPVRDLKGPPVRRLRGIGPIEPRSIGSYEQDYAWMTDVVERSRLVRIEIEYMDRTKKVLTKFDNLRLKDDDLDLLNIER